MRILTLVSATALLAGCSGSSTPDTDGEAPEFFTRLSALCGQAFEGRVTSDDPRDADWASETLVMHVRECSEDVIRIPLHVGEDRSRTWVISVLEDGQMRLKHDHRHEDGEEDAVTQYGGDTAVAGSAGAQDFPVDAYSITMFEREGLNASLTNVWRIEVDQAGAEEARFAYQLTRRNDPSRLFRVEFDLTQPVTAPPAAWGW